MSNIKIGTVVGIAAAIALIIGLVVGVSIAPGASSNAGGLVHNIREQFQAGFDAGEPLLSVVNSSGQFVGCVTTSCVTPLYATATYNPPSLADGVVATTTVTLTGSAVGTPCSVGFSLGGAIGGITYACQVNTAGTALITMDNESGVTQDNATGTLRVLGWSL